MPPCSHSPAPTLGRGLADDIPRLAAGLSDDQGTGIGTGISSILTRHENVYLVKGAHVDRDNVGPETVAAVTPADDGQADPVLQSPSNALLDVSDLCRPNNRGGAVEASLPVFNRLVPLH